MEPVRVATLQMELCHGPGCYFTDGVVPCTLLTVHFRDASGASAIMPIPCEYLLPNQFKSNACTAYGEPTNRRKRNLCVVLPLTRVIAHCPQFVCKHISIKLLAILSLLVVRLKHHGPVENTGANSILYICNAARQNCTIIAK